MLTLWLLLLPTVVLPSSTVVPDTLRSDLAAIGASIVMGPELGAKVACAFTVKRCAVLSPRVTSPWAASEASSEVSA